MFLHYVNESRGGDKSKAIAENLGFNTGKLLQIYKEEFERVRLQKQKSLARQMEIEGEQLENQERALEKLKNKVKDLQREKNEIDSKISELQENQDVENFQGIQKENEQLQRKLAQLKKNDESNAQVLKQLRVQEEELKRKKRGLCGKKEPKKKE